MANALLDVPAQQTQSICITLVQRRPLIPIPDPISFFYSEANSNSYIFIFYNSIHIQTTNLNCLSNSKLFNIE